MDTPDQVPGCLLSDILSLVLEELYRGGVLILGHRGALRDAPENTLASFREALAQGAHGVELDSKLSRDGHVVVIHDRTVDRTTDGRGRVADLTLADLKRLDAGAWFSSRFSGECVPTLDEVVEALPPAAVLNIELTNYGTVGDGLEARVAEVVRRHRAERRVILSSFHPLTLWAARRACALPLALLTGIFNPLRVPNDWLAALVPHRLLHPHAPLVTPALVERVHRQGRRLNAWFTHDAGETEGDLQALAVLGVDGMITNAPELARGALSARN